MDKYFIRDFLIFLTYAMAFWCGSQVQEQIQLQDSDLTCESNLHIEEAFIYSMAPHNSDTSDAEDDVPEQKSIVESTAPGAPVSDDSCEHANDGYCDEPYSCQPGTDKTDCDKSGFKNGTNKYCQWTMDGECDENRHCPRGSDRQDCCINGIPRTKDLKGNLIVAEDVCCGDKCSPPGNNWCKYSNNGQCDEPPHGNKCRIGSDKNDCNMYSLTEKRNIPRQRERAQGGGGYKG